MCGIAAISLSPSSTIPVRQLAHELLLHSEERGKVASGIGWWYGGQPFYKKDALPGGHLPLKVLPKDARTVIVHTRNATYGNPDENDNNHPVTDPHEEIILVHNGVIANHDAIRIGEEGTKFPEVDSSVIPFLIQKEGTLGLAQLDGWAALAWLDKLERDEVNLARLKGNAPMVVVFLKDGSIVMGSTFPIIHAALINVGYGDQIVNGYEVPDHTHIKVKHGVMNLMTNVTPYSWTNSRYKKGKTMSHAEKVRLEKITNGDAVSYGKDAPVHASTTGTPSTTGTAHTPPAPKTTYGVGGGYPEGSAYGQKAVTSPPASTTTPTSGKGSHGTFSGSAGSSVVQTKVGAPEKYVPTGEKVLKDPLAGFKPPPQTPYRQPATITTAGSAKMDSVGGRKLGFPTPAEYPIPRYLEARLTYWVKYEEVDAQTGLVTTYYEDDPFTVADYADDAYLYHEFIALTAEGSKEGYVVGWGVYDKDGAKRWTHHFTTIAGEASAIKGIAEKLPPRNGGRRPTPAGRNEGWPDSSPLSQGRTPGALPPMWDMSDKEWREALQREGIYGE